MSTLRLNKFVSQTTALSRRAADRAIVAGEVRMNGRVTDRLGSMVDPTTDRVEYRGEPLRLLHRHIYLAFYKPKNCLVTKSDPRGRPTIWQWLESYRSQCNAIGRLDFESEGLLLITNDGTLIEKLTHPRHGVAKVYRVKVRGVPDAESLGRIGRGMIVEDAQFQPTPVKVIEQTAKNCWLEMRLHEGKYREVRRMCERIGHPVVKLKRIAVGPITLGDLRPAKTRRLRPREISALRAISLAIPQRSH